MGSRENASLAIELYFNSDLKKEFIDFYNKTEDCAWNSIFLRTKPMEEMLEMDCCNFTYSQIEELYLSFRSTSAGTLAVKNSLLINYTDFCIDKGFSVDNINHYREFTREKLETLIDNKKAQYNFLSENDINEIVDILDLNRDKFLILGLYNGICGKDYYDIITISKNDLLGKDTILLPSTKEKMKIPNKLYNIMVQASEDYEVKTRDGRVRKFYGDNIYKAGGSGEVSKTAINRRIQKLKYLLKRPSLGYKSIIQSGFCNQIIRLAKDKNMDYGEILNSEEGQNLLNKYQMPINPYASLRLMKYFEQSLEERT